MTQPATKQHSPVLLHVVHTIEYILCHDKSFLTLGTHNTNKTERWQKISKELPVLGRS